MRHLLLSATAALFAFGSAPFAQAGVMIDFNDGISGGAIGAFYASKGVTFMNASWDGFISTDEGSVGAGGLKLVGNGDGGNSRFQPDPTNPIMATFSSVVSSFSVQGLNVGANGARIDAYDSVSGGNLIASDTAVGTLTGGLNHPLLSISSSGIRRIELYQLQNAVNEGLLFDNFEFTVASVGVVPEPTSFAVWAGIGMIGLGLRRRQRNASSSV